MGFNCISCTCELTLEEERNRRVLLGKCDFCHHYDKGVSLDGEEVRSVPYDDDLDYGTMSDTQIETLITKEQRNKGDINNA